MDIFFIHALVTLFVVIDPVGLLPIFGVLTAEGDDSYRRRMAIRAVVIASIVLVLFAFGGADLLGIFGITMPAFRIAGGILLFVTAFEMLFEFRTKRRSGHARDTAEDHHPPEDVSAFPLAIPFMAGPGSITSMILLMGVAGENTAKLGLLFGALGAVMAFSLALFLASNWVMRILGETVTTVVTRMLGLVLAALAVQYVIDGIRDVVTVT
ncbi:MAG: MarC family protein [Alphaproteobacteria bacterium]|nr:MAG: MarC family protein [Alphaproteobacteria bacterium]